jgi:hypothetical protein
MLNQIIQEFLILKSYKPSWYVYFSLLGLSLILLVFTKSEFYHFAFDVFSIQYFYAIIFDLKIYWGLTNILVPLLFLYSFRSYESPTLFGTNEDNSCSFFESYLSKLFAIGLVLFIGGAIFGLFLFAKVFYYSNLGLGELTVHLVVFKWIYFITCISIFYFNLLLFLFYCFRSFWLLISFHAFNILLLFFDDLYWLPINWASTSIEYLQHRITPMTFFFEHPPIFFGLFLVAKIVLMFIVLRRIYYKERKVN